MIIFFTGTDTGIGKTIAVGVLARALKEAGRRVITQKLVQTGAEEPEDLLIHRRLMGEPPDPPELLSLTCPYLFSYPAAPELAARLEGKEIDLLYLKRCVEELERRYEIVLVEGAGGLLVPLTREDTMLDFLSLILCPVVVVSAARLGTINHSLLTIKALRQRSLFVAGLVYNKYFVTDEFLAKENLADIKHFGELENVLCLPTVTESLPASVIKEAQNFLKFV